MYRFALVIWMLMCCAVFADADKNVLNVVVVLDDSGSMDATFEGTSRMKAANNALAQVVRHLPDNSKVGVYLLNDGWLIPLGPLNKKQAVPKILAVSTGGGTPLGASMKVASDALLKQRQTNVYGTYRLLIITDGEAGDRALVDKHLYDILSRGLYVDVIGLDMSGDHSLATKVHSYRRGNDKRSLAQAVTAAFAESTGADDESGDSDYDLLQGLESGVVLSAINAMGKNLSNNVPVDQAAPRPFVNSSGEIELQPQASQEGGKFRA